MDIEWQPWEGNIAKTIRVHTLVKLALHALIAVAIFGINRPMDNNAVDINEEELFDHEQDRHYMDESVDDIITLEIDK